MSSKEPRPFSPPFAGGEGAVSIAIAGLKHVGDTRCDFRMRLVSVSRSSAPIEQEEEEEPCMVIKEAVDGVFVWDSASHCELGGAFEVGHMRLSSSVGGML